jgi:hypothetical protein
VQVLETAADQPPRQPRSEIVPGPIDRDGRIDPIPNHMYIPRFWNDSIDEAHPKPIGRSLLEDSLSALLPRDLAECAANIGDDVGPCVLDSEKIRVLFVAELPGESGLPDERKARIGL